MNQKAAVRQGRVVAEAPDRASSIPPTHSSHGPVDSPVRSEGPWSSPQESQRIGDDEERGPHTSAAIATHRLAKPAKVKITNMTFTPSENAMFWRMIQRVRLE